MRIVLTGGGSGGHIYPLVAVARKLRKIHGENVELLFVGPRGNLEKRTMDEEAIASRYIAVGKMRRYFSFKTIADFFKIPLGLAQSLFHLWVFMPDVVFSKGGHASVPVVIAAWLYRIPILTHESDSIPGMANRIIGKFSRRVALSYPRAKRYFTPDKVLLTGDCIRESFSQGNKERALEKFGLSSESPVTLILGGSQGAQNINNAIVNILPDLLKMSQVVHQTGDRNYDETVRRAAVVGIKAGREGYHPAPFFDERDMSDLLACADLVISRAGSSISEMAANSNVALLIPLGTSANDHQSMNAYAIAEIGGALVLEESNLGEHILLDKIRKLLTDQELRKKMSENIRSFYHHDAADKIIAGLMSIIKQK